MSSSLSELLQAEFDLWLDNLNSSSTELSIILEKPNEINLNELQEKLDEMTVDSGELENFRPSTTKKATTITYDFKHALKPLATAKRLTARAQTILAAHSKTAKKEDPPSNTHTTRTIPEMKIGIFKGDITEYNSFMTAFELKYKNLPISDKERLQQLKQHLEGEPRDLIYALELTDKNYELALEKLNEKYADKEQVISELYYKLERLPRASNTNESLSSTFSKLEGILNALESHNQNLDSFPPLRDKVFLKFPLWLVQQVCGPTKPKIKEFLKSISNHLNVRCGLQASAKGQGVSYPKPPRAATASLVSSKPTYKKPGENQSPNDSKTSVIPNCVFCKEKHYSNECPTYTTVAERRALIPDRCFLCLSKYHKKSECTKNTTCRFCKKANVHHSSLCSQQVDKPKSSSSSQEKQSPPASDKSNNEESKDSDTAAGATRTVGFLRTHQGAHVTALLTIVNPTTQRQYQARALFDNGSNETYISEQAAHRMGLKLSKFQTAPVKVFAVEQPVNIRTASTSFIITNKNKFYVEVAADTIQHLPQDVHLFNYEEFKEIYPEHANHRFINQGETETIDILLGSDYYFDILHPETKITITKGLYLFNTPFGWMLAGRQENSSENRAILFQMSPKAALKELSSLESIGVKDEPISVLQEEENALNQFYANIKFDNDNNRYEVKWPWREFPPPLPDNFGLAIGRLKTQQRKFTQQFFDDYNSVIESQIENGIVEEVPNTTADKNTSQKYYLPHHAVLTPQKSTPLRIVFDGAAKQGKNTYSINDVMYKGRNLLAEICAMLLRCRLNKILTTSDLEKAFHQLGIHPEDRDFVRFLWLHDWKKPPTGKNLRILRFMRVAFGIDASPFLLNATLRYHLQQNKNKFTKKILRSIYSDNINAGFKNRATAEEFYHVAVKLFKKCSMNLRAWATNDEKLRSVFQQPNLSSAISILGIIWNQYTDTIRLKNIQPTEVITLRTILSTTAQFFDPCGWWSPIHVMAKILLSEIHTKYDWDDELRQEHRMQWIEIQSELQNASNKLLPRYQCDLDELGRYNLHVFSDASVKAYACVIYLQKVIDNVTTTHLLLSKTKIAPTAQKYNVPHLELFGVLLAIKALSYVRNALELTFEKTILWCDNKCVLSWITGEKILPVFIQRRVDHIRSIPEVEFRYVSSEENSADLPSRGGTLDQVINSRWFEGPKWLQGEDHWPPPLPTPTCCDLPTPVSTVAVITVPKYPFDLDPSKYSSYLNLLRVTTYVMDFLSKFQLVKRCGIFRQDVTMYTAQNLWIEFEQKNHYQHVISSLKENKKNDLVTKLNLYLGSDGLIRCAGRFKYAPLSPKEKCPILLPHPKQSPFVRKLIQFTHETLYHVGTEQVLENLRRKFWLTSGRRAVYNVIRKCPKCKRFTARPYTQPDKSDLPPCRFEKSIPFTNVGIDTLGPVWVNQTKRFVLLVTDLVIRAVDFEMLEDMTTEEIILAFRRVLARHNSKPSLIISDNAPQFKAIHQAFQKMFVHDWNWKFIPEHSPWIGGTYERMVALLKQSLLRTFHGMVLSNSLLRTALGEIAAVLNERPLTYVSKEQENKALTPNHFLNAHYEEYSTDLDNVILKQSAAAHVISLAKKSAELTNRFWATWKHSYLQNLRARGFQNPSFPKQTSPSSPQINEIVLIAEQNKRRSEWRLGRVIKLLRSSDGQVRSVLLLTKSGILVRPVKEVYPLELAADPDTKPAAEPALDGDRDEWDDFTVTVEEIDE